MTAEAIVLRARDGWRVAGDILLPDHTPLAGAVLLHASRHERDAYGLLLPQLLVDAGVAVLRLDVRGRGDSQDPVPYVAMAPRERRGVSDDVVTAVEHLWRRIDGGPVAVVAEQDAVGRVLAASFGDVAPAAYVLFSGRLGRAGRARGVGDLDAPLLCLVSKEDRPALRDMVDLYAASADPRSRIAVYDGLGFGTTMLSVWRFSYPDEPPIEARVAAWLTDVLAAAERMPEPRGARSGSGGAVGRA